MERHGFREMDRIEDLLKYTVGSILGTLHRKGWYLPLWVFQLKRRTDDENTEVDKIISSKYE